MKNGNLKNSITYMLLVIFISMKMTGLHALLHTDDKNHIIQCTICDYAITSNLTPALAHDSQCSTIKLIKFSVQRERINNYNSIALVKLTPGQLFSRPPPSVL